MPTVHVNDIDMYYEVHGEGEPLALIMGMTTDISEWGEVIRGLAQHARVIAADNRGAGRTDKPDQPYSIEMMADDTVGLLRAMGVERSNVLGISMGGRIALALALAHPERVDKLILVSTGARTNRRPWWFGTLGLLSSVPILRGKHPQPRYAFRRQRQASSAFNCVNRLSEIRSPTLILHGKSDRLAPYALAEELHAGIPHSQLVAFNGGHLFSLMSERPRFLTVVADFLAASPDVEPPLRLDTKLGPVVGESSARSQSVRCALASVGAFRAHPARAPAASPRPL